uniref:Uncharacterized protein n=1 Tax=Scophthalmus maximus TaxID=52904 RepID=A0A8D3BE26_SCOMX
MESDKGNHIKIQVYGVRPIIKLFWTHCGFHKCTFRLEDRDPVTEKKESSRPCVLPWRLFTIFLKPLRILSSLASSSGSIHFRSTEEQSTTSGFKNNPLASFETHTHTIRIRTTDCCKHQLTLWSMFSRISSMLPCCLIRSMALLGPIPLIVPQ